MEHVTPFTGVWIEILDTFQVDFGNTVTPFTGVWIEIISSVHLASHLRVTPFTGVWIEIRTPRPLSRSMTSHTLHGCVD